MLNRGSLRSHGNKAVLTSPTYQNVVYLPGLLWSSFLSYRSHEGDATLETYFRVWTLQDRVDGESESLSSDSACQPEIRDSIYHQCLSRFCDLDETVAEG